MKTVRQEKAELLVPQSREEREHMRDAALTYAGEQGLVPPLSLEELNRHAAALCTQEPSFAAYVPFLTVLLGNSVWSETLASIPYERRVVLLPQCLRDQETCPAGMDEFGVLCEECGGCAIGDLQREAEALGSVVLIAEGTTVVTRLLEQGKVDAVIGVSCLVSLEKSFPAMAENAIPGIAIPLLRDGCNRTEVDIEWVREIINLRSEHTWQGRIEIESLRDEVREWFSPSALKAILGAQDTETGKIGMEWMASSGKRWRPVLCVAACEALGAKRGKDDGIRKLAAAVECFHKASLAHDDIEDSSAERYGEPALHHKYGIPIALNAGDYLIGEGYRLIVEARAEPEITQRLIGVAARGHQTLSIGQGEELWWMNNPTPPDRDFVLDVFRRKTAPAFDVAIRIGAVYGGADHDACEALHDFSEWLGTAYQVRDDIEDWRGAGGDMTSLRPSLLLALVLEAAELKDREEIWSLWRSGDSAKLSSVLIARGLTEPAERKARQLLEHYRKSAIRALSPLTNAELKGLLRRIVGRIVPEV